jgi:D-alanine-D-alanine ligase
MPALPEVPEERGALGETMTEMPDGRITVGLLFGGRSAEHDVSRSSAANVFRSLDPERYTVIPIGISRAGRWLLSDSDVGVDALLIADDAPEVALVPGGHGRLVRCDFGFERSGVSQQLDVVFPVLHGPNGEDGTVHGALQLAGIPYVGSGILASSVAMDKDVSKRLMLCAGLPIVPFTVLMASSRIDYAAAVSALGATNLFVKPANMGSSVGISRARSAEEFTASCDLAFRYDSKVLIEQCVNNAREIECSILEDVDGNIHASRLGEIAPASGHGFYSYTAKYIDAAGAELRIPANLGLTQETRIRELAVTAFRTLCCEGLARVDFFLEPDSGRLFVSEVNTLPGFTPISMFPKLWEASGISQPQLMDKLIAHAFARHHRRETMIR